MGWGERQFTSLLTIPVEPATKAALLSWDQLLVFDIKLDNQKLPLFFYSIPVVFMRSGLSISHSLWLPFFSRKPVC